MPTRTKTVFRLDLVARWPGSYPRPWNGLSSADDLLAGPLRSGGAELSATAGDVQFARPPRVVSPQLLGLPPHPMQRVPGRATPHGDRVEALPVRPG